MTALTIGITTRNRPDSLRRCLDSIARSLGTRHDVLVFDDASDVPVTRQLEGFEPRLQLRVLREEGGVGYIAGRNEMARQARHELVLLLDDDAVVFRAEAVAQAVAVLDQDPGVGAVAFAQAEADGRPWPERMQPGAGRVPAYVPCFIGFAHLLRRSLFLSLGGYRSDFVFYGEEKDFCVRMLDAGFRTVYLPDALIAHVVDLGGRDQRRYVRYAIRNDCLSSIYNDPWPVAAIGIPVRFRRFGRMAAQIPGGDPGGLGWLAREVARALPRVLRARRPVRWSTLREWRRLRAAPRYDAQHAILEPQA